MAGSQCFRVDASRADGQTVCGYQQYYVHWGVFAALLPEPNGEPDAEEQSSVEHAGEMNCFLSAQNQFLQRQMVLLLCPLKTGHNLNNTDCPV